MLQTILGHKVLTQVLSREETSLGMRLMIRKVPRSFTHFTEGPPTKPNTSSHAQFTSAIFTEDSNEKRDEVTIEEQVDNKIINV